MLMDSDGFLWILMVRISGYGDLHGANFRLWKFASAVVPFKWSPLRASQSELARSKQLAKITEKLGRLGPPNRSEKSGRAQALVSGQ